MMGQSYLVKPLEHLQLSVPLTPARKRDRETLLPLTVYDLIIRI